MKKFKKADFIVWSTSLILAITISKLTSSNLMSSFLVAFGIVVVMVLIYVYWLIFHAKYIAPGKYRRLKEQQAEALDNLLDVVKKTGDPKLIQEYEEIAAECSEEHDRNT